MLDTHFKATLGSLSPTVQKSVKSRLGHRLGRQQERWEMTQQEDQRKYDQRRGRSIPKGWTKKYKSVPHMEMEEKGENHQESVALEAKGGEFRRD